MKIGKTLVFLLLHPIPFIVLMAWSSFFAALSVVLDDPFRETIWPRVVQIMTSPWSVGDLATAASIVVAEIFRDVTHHSFWILIGAPPFIISYREARGNLRGTAKEQHKWTEWYRRQENAIAANETFAEVPPSSEKVRINSYFRKARQALSLLIRDPKPLLIHFPCWFFGYFLLVLMTELPDIADVVWAAGSFARNFSRNALPLAIIAAILSFISSYQETRGAVKGTAKVRQTWEKWYYQQQKANSRGIPFDTSPPAFYTTG